MLEPHPSYKPATIKSRKQFHVQRNNMQISIFKLLYSCFGSL
uniref:Uncharacterized protein n=1 Tax=Anguilla anguilla TaxID=7936 RepID=A0A0E9SWB6_ANGAN